MNLFSTIRNDIIACLKKMEQSGEIPSGLAYDAVEAVPPKDITHGDVATNAAMVLAGKAGKKPRDIAESLCVLLRDSPSIHSVEIAGPGFINIRFKPAFWLQLLPEILTHGRGYGNSKIGANRRVNVEYVSANPTGPMHVGHVRGAVYGDVLSLLLLKAGFHVTKEYYINDAGGQIDKLADSAFLRYREALGEKISEIPEGLYPGDYLVPVGEALAATYKNELLLQEREQWLPLVRQFAMECMMALIKEDLAALGIHHDVFSSEKSITDAGNIEQALKLLDDKGLIYTGVLEPPKGKAPEDWEPRPQTLFRATQFGDDVDRAIKKSDGSWTYFAPDIAYHLDKYRRGHDLLIDVFGADHGGYAKRIKAAVAALSDGKCEVDVKLCQMIKFLRDGEPAKMSKRAGTFVTARDVVEEVGKDVFRFIMLTRKNDAPLDFDFQKVTEQSKDNPVFYVQYAHARARSVIRNIERDMPQAVVRAKNPDNALIELLDSEPELELIKHMASWPRTVEGAALAYEPHRIATYLHELAALFHGFWNKGNDDVSLRFIISDDTEKTAARLVLAQALSLVVASGLMVLGVEPVEEMR